MSTDPASRGGFGPFLPGVGPKFLDKDEKERIIRFGVIEDLEEALELHGKYTAGFLVEPIQGETGYFGCFTQSPSILLTFFFSPESSYHQKGTCRGFGSCATGITYY